MQQQRCQVGGGGLTMQIAEERRWERSGAEGVLPTSCPLGLSTMPISSSPSLVPRYFLYSLSSLSGKSACHLETPQPVVLSSAGCLFPQHQVPQARRWGQCLTAHCCFQNTASPPYGFGRQVPPCIPITVILCSSHSPRTLTLTCLRQALSLP